MTEPTDEQLQEIVAEGGDESPELEFEDRIIILENGQALLSRVITNTDQGDALLTLYRPAEIVQFDTGELYLREWLPVTDDDYIFIGMDRVITIVQPNDMMLSTYLEQIEATPEDYIPEGTQIH